MPSPILIVGCVLVQGWKVREINVISLSRSIVCILGGGLAAGLTIGLMSLDNGTAYFCLFLFLLRLTTPRQLSFVNILLCSCIMLVY